MTFTSIEITLARSIRNGTSETPSRVDDAIGSMRSCRAMADLETMTRHDLMRLRADIDRAISTAGERDKRKALQAAENAVREHGFTLAEIAQLTAKGGRGVKRVTSERAARYRNPDNPEQT